MKHIHVGVITVVWGHMTKDQAKLWTWVDRYIYQTSMQRVAKLYRLTFSNETISFEVWGIRRTHGQGEGHKVYNLEKWFSKWNRNGKYEISTAFISRLRTPHVQAKTEDVRHWKIWRGVIIKILSWKEDKIMECGHMSSIYRLWSNQWIKILNNNVGVFFSSFKLCL